MSTLDTKAFSDDISSDKDVFRTRDPLNREVKLKTTTWSYKICNFNCENDNNVHGNSHQEMEELLDKVKLSIECPHYILKDTKIQQDLDGNEEEVPSDTREEYIMFYFNDTNQEMNSIKTIVEYNEEKTLGDIVTTFRITGRIKQYKSRGGIIYDATTK